MASKDRLELFQQWLFNQGLTHGTVRGYALNVSVATSYDDPVMVLRRKGLSPNTLARYRAALTAWAQFTEDVDLQKRLRTFRLPPARRMSPKVPFTPAEWRKLVQNLPSCPDVSPRVKAVIGIMLMRGLRIADVLKIERANLEESLQTGILSYCGKGTKYQETSIKHFELWARLLLQFPRWDRVYQAVSKSEAGESAHLAAASMRVYTGLKKLAETCGMDPELVHPHRLRRTYAVMFLEQAENNLVMLRDHMGWASVTTAAAYTDHNQRKELEAKASAMLERILKEEEPKEVKSDHGLPG